MGRLFLKNWVGFCKGLANNSKAPVTVIIVNWNSGDWLKRCFQGIATQTVQPQQVLGNQTGVKPEPNLGHPLVGPCQALVGPCQAQKTSLAGKNDFFSRYQLMITGILD